MTTSELARLRALCEAATPGPWDWTPDGGLPILISGRVFGGAKERGDGTDADAAFIAAARTALPALLTEVEAFRFYSDEFCQGDESAEDAAHAMFDAVVAHRTRAEKAESALSRARAEVLEEAVRDYRLPVLASTEFAAGVRHYTAFLRALDASPSPSQQTGGGEPNGPWEWGATMAYREQGMDLAAASAKAQWLSTQLRRTDAPRLWHVGPAPAAQTTDDKEGTP